MRRDAIAEQIETRPNERPDDEITERHDYQIVLPGGMFADLTVTYKPDRLRLVDGVLEAVTDAELFDEGDAIEEITSDVYWALVASLYPKRTYLDEPWTTLPLIVEIEFEGRDSDRFVSLGSYR